MRIIVLFVLCSFYSISAQQVDSSAQSDGELYQDTVPSVKPSKPKTGVRLALLTEANFMSFVQNFDMWVPTDAPFLLGFKLCYRHFGLDGKFGFLSTPAIGKDSASHTSQTPKQYDFFLSGALSYQWVVSSALQLNTYVSFGVNRRDMFEYASSFDGAIYSDVYRSYPFYIRVLSFGVEPEYSPNPWFSIYTKLGIKVAFAPNSEALVNDNSSDPSKTHFVARKDAGTYCTMDAISLGLRFYVLPGK